MNTTATSDDIRRFRENLQGELDGISVYRAMSEAEKNPPLKVLYHKLAENEVKHAAVWKQKLRDAGVDPSRMGPSWRARVLRWAAGRFGACNG